MGRRRWFVVVVGAASAVLLVAVATSGRVRYVDGPPSIPWNLEFDASQNEPLPTIPSMPIREPVDGSDTGPPTVVTSIFEGALYVGLAVLLGLLAWQIWQHRPRLTWYREPQDDFDILDEIAESVSADAAEQRAALLQGISRDAIVTCWLRLEQAIIATGFRRDPADTSEEFTARVLALFPVDPAAIHELAALYREARFSTHPMGEAARRTALEALDKLHAGMRVKHSEPDRVR